MKLIAQAGALVSAVTWVMVLLSIVASEKDFPDASVSLVTLVALGAVVAAVWICRGGSK